MNKKSKSFLIILSLFVCLFTSCGIPNYFGNTNKYVDFKNQILRLYDVTYADGFSTTQVEPKVMFLYTIYSTDKFGTLPNSEKIETKLGNEFEREYRITDNDYKGCSNKQNETVVEVKFKDTDSKEYTPGLYQLQTMGVVTNPSSYTGTPQNHSNEYLFNKDNLEFRLGETYTFDYKLEKVEESTDVTLIISCLNSNSEVVAAYRMGNFNTKAFHTSMTGVDLKDDYNYASDSKTNTLYILPVLYLESNPGTTEHPYNNRQMKLGTWFPIDLKLPEVPEKPTEPDPAP